MDLTETALPATVIPNSPNAANGFFITMTPVPVVSPYNTRLVTIPMSYFTVSLEYFMVSGDQVNLLFGDEVIATNATVIELFVLNNGSELRAVSLAVHYEDIEKVVDTLQSIEALQSEETFTVELILPTDVTTTPTPMISSTPVMQFATQPPAGSATTIPTPTISSTPVR